MPRLSPEARASRLYLSGSVPPSPPVHLSQRASNHWQQVVEARAPDYFDSGTWGLLGNFCSALAEADRVGEVLASEKPGSARSTLLTKNYAIFVGIAATLGRQLRLTKAASSDKKSGEHDERGVGRNPLLGGVANLRQ